MEKIDLNQFYTWVEENPERRGIEIKLGHTGNCRVWAYDYDMMDGAYVSSVSEIPDFEKTKEQKDFRQFQELQVKFAKKESPADTEDQENTLPDCTMECPELLENIAPWEPEAVVIQEG